MFWKRPKSLAPLLYFANRLILLVVSLVTVVARFATSSNTCKAKFRFLELKATTTY